MSSPKVLFFDIESTSLKADFGTLLCVGMKYMGSDRFICPAITDWAAQYRHDPTDERLLLGRVNELLSEADVWVTYNGKRFDVPYLQAKMLEYGLPVLPNAQHIDLYWTCRHNLAISRRSLEKVAWYLKLNNSKEDVDGRVWRKAAAGHRESVLSIVDHCEADVILLEELYHRLKPLVRQHPRIFAEKDCGTCGNHGSLIGRGCYYTKSGKVSRRQCKTCGTWSRGN